MYIFYTLTHKKTYIRCKQGVFMEKNQDVRIEKKIGRPKTNESNKKHAICIYLKDEMYDKIQKQTKETYVPISRIVELALQKYLV